MGVFQIIPAIDLRNGRCVRLTQGRADAETVYSDDPVGMARQWEQGGAPYLHVVDLDGAFAGHPVHLPQIRAIAQALKIPVDLGGGLRTDADLQAAIEAGVDRVILGTRACEHPEDLARLASRFGTRLAVGVDARGGWVQTRGWVETSALKAEDLVRRIAAAGVRTLIYTDTATDGMLGGPNLEAVRAVCRAAGPEVRVIASGGVVTAEHIRQLKALKCNNLIGAIVGKALYDGRVTLAELLAVAADLA
jgi:phosphoribosylformimino-5-aminoimidazole carboxamide ribotide isomerase